jgi:hypothetical protein
MYEIMLKWRSDGNNLAYDGQDQRNNNEDPQQPMKLFPPLLCQGGGQTSHLRPKSAPMKKTNLEFGIGCQGV